MRPAVLVISHKFPPYSRVGAYRWARLSSRLAELGHEVHVLSVVWPPMEGAEWLADIERSGLYVHRTRSGYPQYLKYLSAPGAVDKWLLRPMRGLLRYFPAYDEASRWGRWLLPAARDLIRKHDIRCVVATGGPFSALYWAARLRAQDAGIRLVQDFRDPWFLTAPNDKKDGWWGRYMDALQQADAVVGVTPEMVNLLALHANRDDARFHCIENGVDFRELRALAERNSRTSAANEERVDFIHAGSIFAGRHVPLVPFFAWMRRRRQQARPVSLELVGRVDRRLPGFCRDLLECGDIRLVPTLPQEKVFQHILRSRRALHLNAPESNQTQVSTKLIEYAGLRVPTLSLNYGGAVDALIRKEDLGWSLCADDPWIMDRLDAVVDDSGQFRFSVERYDFVHLANRYSDLLDSITRR